MNWTIVIATALFAVGIGALIGTACYFIEHYL